MSSREKNLLPKTRVSQKPKIKKSHPQVKASLFTATPHSEGSPRQAAAESKNSKKNKCHCPLSPLPAAMVSPMFFDISADGKPLSCISSKLLEDKVPKTAENFRALSMGKKGFGYNVSSFLIIITDSCASMVNSYTV